VETSAWAVYLARPTTWKELPDAKQIVFETIYGKGDLTIKLADIEAIETDGDFYLWHGDDVETPRRTASRRWWG